MDLGLTGRKAIVTGGSRGIGKAIAWQLAREGCELAICSRNEGPLRESADEIAADCKRKVVAIPCDTLIGDDIRRFIGEAAAELGGLHIVVNSAARPSGRPGIDEATIEDVDMADVRRDFEEKVLG
ncbi:MAG: SDR family NAD(P)-dependent oxidoreductase, partial [Burkholderiaceae bacterium]